MFDFINTQIVKAQVARQDGQAIVEYGLVVGAVSLVVLAAATTFSGTLNTMFAELGTAVGTLPPTP
jgi:Flp pilus assembly pilin Flp